MAQPDCALAILRPEHTGVRSEYVQNRTQLMRNLACQLAFCGRSLPGFKSGCLPLGNPGASVSLSTPRRRGHILTDTRSAERGCTAAGWPEPTRPPTLDVETGKAPIRSRTIGWRILAKCEVRQVFLETSGTRETNPQMMLSAAKSSVDGRITHRQVAVVSIRHPMERATPRVVSAGAPV
jgi:hypothetical protein